MVDKLRSARRALGRIAERLRALELRLGTIRAGVPVPAWPQEADYDESMARDPAIVLAHDIEHVLAAYLGPAIAALDRAAAGKIADTAGGASRGTLPNAEITSHFRKQR